jgi:hypothetical protein
MFNRLMAKGQTKSQKALLTVWADNQVWLTGLHAMRQLPSIGDSSCQ